MNAKDLTNYYKKKEIARTYDKSRFSCFSGWLFDRLEKYCIIKLLKYVERNRPVKFVLDAPCGTGRITELLARQGFEIVGADISEEMIETAREKLPAFRNIVFNVADIKNIPFRDNYFDCVVCIRLFHHLDQKDRVDVLKELSRVAGGYIIVNLSFSSPWYRLRRKFKNLMRQSFSRVALTDSDIKVDLEQCGLELVKKRFVLPLVSEDLVLVLKKGSG